MPGILAHAMVQVSDAATAMSKGAMANFSNALLALGRGDLDAAHARVDLVRVRVRSGDEVGAMAASINLLQEDIARAAGSLDRAREELRVARHDALTGLITRREFERRLDAALAKTHAGQRWYALQYLDLDHFKIVNDTCGHSAGDELLRQITGVLRAVVRNRDSVARLGGDEFAMLLDDCPPQSAQRIAQDLLNAIQGFSFASGENIFKIGGSIGLITFCDDSLELLELMRAADDACYVAKKKGRNRVQVYQPADTGRRAGVNSIGSDDCGGPCMNAGSACTPRKSSSFRRPANPNAARTAGTHDRRRRCHRGTDGVHPDRERFGMMPAIDRFVISTSFKEIASIIAREGPVEAHRWSINLSGASLGEDDFLDFVRSQFETFGVPPAAVCFEITETAAIASFARATHFIQELKRLGCGFALDDFGSGFSSFGYLKHLPVDYLKIDGVFVRDIAGDPVDRAMVEAINKVGQIMGIATIAESVETDETLAILQAIGVDYAQGFRISRPKPFILPPGAAHKHAAEITEA